MIAPDLQALAYPVDKLDLLEGNPRKGDVESVRRSYERFGQRKPIVARHREDGRGEVIAGNHQLLAARVLDWDEIAVVWSDDDDITAKAFALADNRTSELGSMDEAALAAMLRDVALDADLLAASSYSEEELAALLGKLAPDDDDDDEGAVAFDVYDAETIADLAFAHYRERGFPYRKLNVFESLQAINALAAQTSAALVHSTIGYAVADTYHPHRFAAKVHGKQTPLEAFASDKYLRETFNLCWREGKLINDKTVLSILAYVRGAQAAANFRPGYALSMYRRFASDGARVLDTSTGYGGRLIGFLASTCAHYVGVDPNSETFAGNLRMLDELGASERATLIGCPAEDVEVERIGRETCDFAFTSPPYFAKERYSDEATQSCNRYASGDDWREGFLRPMLRLQYATLKHERHNVVNIADVKVKSVTYPLVDWTISCALDVGFELVRQEDFPLGRVPGQGVKSERSEPVLIFRKR